MIWDELLEAFESTKKLSKIPFHIMCHVGGIMKAILHLQIIFKGRVDRRLRVLPFRMSFCLFHAHYHPYGSSKFFQTSCPFSGKYGNYTIQNKSN